MTTLSFTNLDEAYAFFSAYHKTLDAMNTAEAVPAEKTLEATLVKAAQETLRLLENAAMPRSFITKLQKEVRFLGEKADLSLLDAKIADLLKVGLPRSSKPVSTEKDLRQFCIDKIDLLLSYIFYQFNLHLFAGWKVTVRKADLQKLAAELATGKSKRQLSPEETKFKENVAKFDKRAEKVREAFYAAGGERISLKTDDNVSLDGFYLSASAFRKELQGAGVKRFSLSSKDLPFKEGLIIDSTSPFLQTLKDNFAKNGFAFVPVRGTNQTLIIDEKWPQFSSGVTLAAEDKLKETHLEIETPGGTVILGGGMLSTYGLDSGEALALLAKGLNVVVFNYRGYGQSTGFPTTEGTYKDIETVYQFVKKEIQSEDKKIIAKGYCLSGYIMAELARKHPQINLILDRTTSTLYSFIKHSLINLLKERFQSVDKSHFLAHFISALLTPLLWLLSPSYNTLAALKTLQGHAHVIEAEEDLQLPAGTYEEMKSVMKKAGRENLLSHTLLPLQDRLSAVHQGTSPHDLRWLDAKKELYAPPEKTPALPQEESPLPPGSTARPEALDEMPPHLPSASTEAIIEPGSLEETALKPPSLAIGFGAFEGMMPPKLASVEYAGRASLDSFLSKLHLLESLVK